MNIQTETQADHTAKLVVEFDVERLEKAKVKAAKKISNQINIPGFRKGKAPYRLVAKYVGEASIIDDAMELISNDIYKEALLESKLDPYGPGAVLEYQLDPAPTLIFSVPLQPTVTLNAYRDVRLPYEPIAVEDEQIEQTFKNLLREHALVEDSSRPAEMGNRVTVDIHSFIESSDEDEDEDDDMTPKELLEAVIEEEAAEELLEDLEDDDEDFDDELDDDEDEDDEHEHTHEHFINDHDAIFDLETEDEIAPGFSAALVGVTPGETREFALTMPEDDEEYPGRKINFEVHVKNVQVVTMPTLNDDFAARVTKDEEKPLTLLELRVRIRENLERMASEQKNETYSDEALKLMVDQAEVSYPQQMLEDQVQDMMERLDQRLRQQRLTLQDYMSIYRKTPQDMFNDYKPIAEASLKRLLVMREVGRAEQINVTDEDLQTRADEMVASVRAEEQSNARNVLEHPMMRDNLREQLTRERIIERVITIAKGEAPELPPAEAPVAAEPTTTEVAEPVEEKQN
ncbi:MAG: trigger factor [Chloroflexota bacterium]|nr:trigger factor [Chloroflexota bacterium]